MKVDDGELPQRKGHQGFKHSKSTPRAKRVETRRRGRAKRNRIEVSLLGNVCTRGVLLLPRHFALCRPAQVTNLAFILGYWESARLAHRFPSSVMARDRLFDMLACFTFTDARLKELQPILEQHLRVIWEPANAAVVDEMWLLTKVVRMHIMCSL